MVKPASSEAELGAKVKCYLENFCLVLGNGKGFESPFDSEEGKFHPMPQ